MSSELRNIMRRNVNYIDQTRVVNSLNEQFGEASSAGRFATAVVGTYFAPTRSLAVCSAGHPPLLVRRADSQHWTPLESPDPDDDSQTNLPFGIIDGLEFQSTTLKLSPGESILAYTDSLFEAVDADGKMLQAAGIAQIANRLGMDPGGEFVTALLQQIRELNDQNLAADDTTVLLVRTNTERVSLKDNILAPFRLLRGLFG